MTVPARLLLSIAMMLVLATGASAQVSPADRVKRETNKVLTVLRDKTLARDDKWARVAGIIQKNFDFAYMSRTVLGNNWREATQEERRQFTSFFAQYLESVYRSRIESYTDEDVAFDREKISGKRAVVDTRIVSGKINIPVNYKMRFSDGQWRVYDVVIEGVSMVSNYRNTFNAIAQTSGMQGILNDVERRVTKYRLEQAAGKAKSN